jgi:chromosome segregation ATPase
VISVAGFYKEYRLQVIALNKENQELRHRIHYLESQVKATEDEKAIVKTMNAVINDTSVTFKNKIYQDRHFFDTLCDQKDREYHRLQSDYNNLILDHKTLCEKYAELEISKAKADSEASLKRADDQRVPSFHSDHKQTERPTQRIQGRQRKAENRARHDVVICLDGENLRWQPSERPLVTR